MTHAIRLLLLVELSTFVAAASIHLGVLLDGYDHRPAGIAESVIGAVLLIGLALSLVRPGWTAPVGFAAQAFALLGTVVGIFTIAVGVGPRTLPDIAYHVGIAIVLVGGLVVAGRART